MDALNIKVIVLSGPGTNCDRETLFAFQYLGTQADEETLRVLSKHTEKLHAYHILVLPGGFTYGDYAGAGNIFAVEFSHSLGNEIKTFLAEGKFILGICNGFQVLVKSGLLPAFDHPFEAPSVTLEANTSLRFEDRWIHLKTENKNFWTKGLPGIIILPVAHAEGRFVTRDKKALRRIQTEGHVLFSYSTPDGGQPKYPDDPNGSEDHIAAITDSTGQVMGMMPHPERFVLPQQHPSHTRSEFKGEPHGYLLLANLVNEARKRFG
ncbi:phosphoribosylformylglycinamidine synthase I [candidate division WOR-3 bacterium]|nr:phosphoribosylformylglycinamidine synthase I [candidate division WOR-3 bacterium]